MFLPLLLLFTLLSGCAADSDCKFGNTVHRASPIPPGLGVNIHFTDPKPGEMKMIAAAGFRWVRMDFKWDVTERERGRYDFTEYDRLMKALDEYKIQGLFILDYGNPLYDQGSPPRTAETKQAFARWAVAAAKHFSNRGVLWEIYNEPNISMFWPPRPNAKEYIDLALTVGKAFRSQVPDEKLIGPAVSEIDSAFLDACFKAGLLDYWYAVSVHPYRQTDPETAVPEYCRLRKLIEAYRFRSGSDRTIPIISGEWGYSSALRGMDEEKQGAMYARQMLTNLANQVPLSIWYDWRDDGTDASEAEHHYGLVRNEYQAGKTEAYEAKPAYQAAKTLSEFFAGYVFEQRIAVGREDDYVLAFTKGAEHRFAAWTTSASTHRINVPIDKGQFRVIRHTGESIGSAATGGAGLSIEVSTQPVYLARTN
jgi:hypothetical protein